MKTIGFIGLGHMGQPMVKNLLQADYRVVVFDIAAEAVATCVQWGAVAADSLATLAKQADVIISMLQTGEQVSQVILGEEGCLKQAKPKTLFIDSSSIDVVTSRAIHQQVKNAGHGMVDAPVSGGVAGAKAGNLTMMVGGDDTEFRRALPVLQVLGAHIVHAGPPGNGQVAKICNNMILGTSMIAISESFTLAKRLGLAPEKLFEISTTSSGQCWAMSHYSPVPGLVEGVPSNNHYQPGFSAAMMLKDLRLSQHAAKLANLDTPLGGLATTIYQQFAEGKNQADIDFSAIITMIEENNN